MLPDFFADDRFSDSLRLAAQAAQAAGQIIADGYQDVQKVEVKDVGDLVSKVDFDADRAATAILENDGVTIVSEELNPEANDESADMWIVDPLDGTTSYLMKGGSHISSTLVAKRVGGETVVGICYFPLTDEWFYAEKGQGAWRNGEPLRLTPDDKPLGECWVEMNQYGNQGYETPFFARARTALRSAGGAQIVTSGFPHAGIAMRIAEQNSGLAVAIHDNNADNLKQGPWDIAGPQLIFEEAGGVFLNPDGERTNLFQADPIIIAPSRELAMRVLECVQRA